MALTKEQFIADFKDMALKMYAAPLEDLSSQQLYQALALLTRTYIAQPWADTKKRYDQEETKQVYYFSIEFLPGRLLQSNLLNLGILDAVEAGLRALELHPQKIFDAEADPGLGNGGLGRLASAFMDAMASVGMAGNGNGIRYQYGLFKQAFVNGYQVELPDDWMRNGFPWETRKENRAVTIKFGGWVELKPSRSGNLRVIYHQTDDVLAVPYDVAMVGYHNGVVNNLRLWSAEAPINAGSRFTLEQKERINQITQILYPDDSDNAGKELRLRQEYFFTSAGIQSIVRHYRRTHNSMAGFADRVAIHINDTHPAMAIPELMRVLMDDEHVSWNEAWRITLKVMSYTNHTLLSEALEVWPIDMFSGLLPRIYQIVQEIDRRFRLAFVPQFGQAMIDRIAPLGNGQVRMAYLATIGSHAINGVAPIHSELLKKDVLHDLFQIFPERFNNKTNGITPRRWIQIGDRPLAHLLDKKIGTTWRKNPLALRKLHDFSDDPQFLSDLNAAKAENKRALAKYIDQTVHVKVDPDAIFDVQIKRLHAYKRQLLHVLGILDAYLALKRGEKRPKRLHIFGAKAAPSYVYAKEIIKVMNAVADMVNGDPEVSPYLQVVFLPNYGVTMAEKIIPAADISEQISTAGKEASGTSNMKLMSAGALTLATLDGANIEIKNAVGDDNIEIFGLTEDEIAGYYRRGDYRARDFYEKDPRLHAVLDMLVNGQIPGIETEGRDIFNSLLTYNDEYFVLADFESYLAANAKLDALYQQPQAWAKKALVNIAESGRFSADFTVQRYGRDIWHVVPQTPEDDGSGN